MAERGINEFLALFYFAMTLIDLVLQDIKFPLMVKVLKEQHQQPYQGDILNVIRHIDHPPSFPLVQPRRANSSEEYSSMAVAPFNTAALKRL